MKRIQETPEYIIVKRMTSREAKRNFRKIVLQAAGFVGAVYAWMYLLLFLML